MKPCFMELCPLVNKVSLGIRLSRLAAMAMPVC